jgi:hypothetical protein
VESTWLSNKGGSFCPPEQWKHMGLNKGHFIQSTRIVEKTRISILHRVSMIMHLKEEAFSSQHEIAHLFYPKRKKNILIWYS